MLVSTASINVQVSGFLKNATPRRLLVPPSFQASACRARINLQSPLSLERLSSFHGALFLFSLSCPSWFPTAECYLQIVGAVGYFYDKVSKYPGDEEIVFREQKRLFPPLFCCLNEVVLVISCGCSLLVTWLSWNANRCVNYQIPHFLLYFC